MGFAGFPEEALLFFEGLEADNSKVYWNDHRASYEQDVRGPMLALLDQLGPEFGSAHVFRPNRDVRFSRDKSPYKTAIGAVTERGGYVQLSSNGLLVAAGYWRTASDQVTRLREAVDDKRSGRDLERLVARLEGGGYEVSGSQLATRPRGYDLDHPRIRLLRHRTLTAHRHLEPEPWLHTKECQDRVAAAWRELGPLATWLDRHVGPSRLTADRRR